MNEKKLAYILFALAAVAIMIVILVNIPWGGDKAKIMREYDSLTSKDHVFVTITYDQMMKKIENNETFQVYIGSKELNNVEQFVFEANKLAKEFNFDTIYYLRYSSLTQEQLTRVKVETSPAVSFPTLAYFETHSEGRSSTYRISGLKDFSGSYQSNWLILLTEYFNECLE